MLRTIRFSLFAGIILFLAAASARADSFSISLDTSPLSGTQDIVFGLTDGGVLDNNTVTLSAFTFGGGGAVGSPDLLGTTGATGDLTTGITLDDSSFIVLFSQQFNPGSLLSFVLTTTNNSDGVTPDAFSMSICSADLTICYSDDQSTGALLVLNLPGGALSSSDFTLNGAGAQNLQAPLVVAPEPAGLLLLTGGLLGCLLMKKARVVSG